LELTSINNKTQKNLLHIELREILSDYSFEDLQLDDKTKKKVLELKELTKNIEDKIIKKSNYDATKIIKLII